MATVNVSSVLHKLISEARDRHPEDLGLASAVDLSASIVLDLKREQEIGDKLIETAVSIGASVIAAYGRPFSH